MEGEKVELRALRSLGLGFDLTHDFRLQFAKEFHGGRLVQLDESRTRDVLFPGGHVVRGVSEDIGLDKGDRIRFRSDVLEFNQMSELLNQKSSVQGKVPSGYFNALFDLTGAWLEDAKETKYLAFDGYFISLYNLHLKASPLVLHDEVKRAVPLKWDPVSLSCNDAFFLFSLSFIRTFGTHIIVEVAIGGQDVVCVRQTSSSRISSTELKMHLKDLGDFLFSDGISRSPLHRKTREGKNKAPEVFTNILQSNTLNLAVYSEASTKEGLTVICSKRGGDVYISTHSNWLQTVQNSPDAILLKFVPITSLLTGIPGGGYLSHAINLYLRYKPDPEDLQCFLEFQVPNQWAPMFNELALGPQRTTVSYPKLQFRFFGPKLHVNTDQVLSNQKPVIGMRLYLEGPKCNRLAIHLQHLSSLPTILRNTGSSWISEWQGSVVPGPGYFEPIQWKNYSAICTLAVKHDPIWLQRVTNGVFVVIGAQLIARGNWSKKVLHLCLQYMHIPHCTIRKTEWSRAPASSLKGSFLTNLSTTFSTPFTPRDAPPPAKNVPSQLNSGVYPDGPPVLVQSRKLLKFVNIAEVVRGPHNVPGHWLVTAAKLTKEKGKITLHVKFALLHYSAEAEMFN
ncbi:hypothetical protein ZIOFF_063480 [Zingiber officinale]|uniref:MACPF domain-containing protein n=1 Tax=Zingiber officinale TaxID=94328 RepID=A0A8J5F274_ZINOF|nr:hypothetical protein ZIOFF_063480 [Zingiber officinale]